MIQASVSYPDGGLTLKAAGSQAHMARRLHEAGIAYRKFGDSVLVSFDAASALLRSGIEVELDGRARRALHNRAQVREAAPQVIAEVRRLQDAGPATARQAIRNCRLSDRLDDHQATNVALMTVPTGWGAAIFDEQGTGKTITTVAAFDVLVERGEADVMIVVAPKSMVGVWADEIKKFTGDLYKVVAVASGHRAARDLISGADVYVMNYERAVALMPNIELLAKRCQAILVVDESYNVKNPSAIRTGALIELREWCSRAFVLCGTPAPNAPEDMLSQLDLVDFGYTFRKVRGNPSADATSVSSALATRSVYSRNLKRDVLPNLPDRTFTRVSVTLAPKQQILYTSTLDSLIGDVQKATAASFARQRAAYLARRMALLRICSNPRPLDPTYDEVPTKLAGLDELLRELVDSREKVVIWSFYRASLDELAHRYANYGVSRVDGSVVDSGDRRDAIARFQEDEETMIFIGNPAAAGAGLTLHRARIAIYESLSNQAAHYLQSLDRIHRRGQNRSVEYITLLCDGTIEEVEYARLLHKADVQANLLGDPHEDPLTRDVMLDELLELRRRLSEEAPR